MADTQRKNVGKASEHVRPDLLIWHGPFDWKDKKGDKHHTKGHYEVNPQLSAARKAEARKLKAAKEAARPKPVEAPRPRAKKEPKPAEAVSPALLNLAAKNAKEAAAGETRA